MSAQEIELPEIDTEAPGPVGEGARIADSPLLLEVDLDIVVELGRTQLSIGEFQALQPGSLFELERLAGEPVDIIVNGRKLARGEVMVSPDDRFGVRITEITMTDSEQL